VTRATLLFALLLAACGHRAPAAQEPAPPKTLVASRTAHAPTIDGEAEEPEWLADARTPRFVDATSGRDTPPYTESRALWDAQALYLALYAGDEDLEPSDRLGAVLRAPSGRTVVVEVDPASHVRWHAPGAAAGATPAGVEVGVDADGTLAQPSDEDEEWIVELRIPWRALGADGPCDVRANFFRRDVPPGAAMRALAWIAWRERPSSELATLGRVRLAGRNAQPVPRAH